MRTHPNLLVHILMAVSALCLVGVLLFPGVDFVLTVSGILSALVMFGYVYHEWRQKKTRPPSELEKL